MEYAAMGVKTEKNSRKLFCFMQCGESSGLLCDSSSVKSFVLI